MENNAVVLHQNVPPDWYRQVIEKSPIHRFWHLTRFREVCSSIEKTKGPILDIGCADGTFSKIILEKSGASGLIGIDILARSVAYARKRFARNKKMLFEVADAHNLPYKDESFSAVFAMESVEHMENPKKVLREMYRVVKQGGYVLILVPSENLLFRIGWFFWTLGPGKIWRGTHTHRIHPAQISGQMQKIGFRILEERSFLFGMLKIIKARK